VKKGTVEREPPFRDDSRAEAAEFSLLEAVTRERLVKTIRLEKTKRVLGGF
jgi:hypothetical protein